ncbi:hypothetical protein AVEN_163068-1 [Araneus ventricosus]|uniref:Uncharacterized protein n=1 Tax=Araneus ventricosus TaxID=182803 RepID=A0A4Y2P338_ARAVE|nr:hypothetical protein AVEN_163068-1 [Araneus ventricosus]
MRGWCLRSVTGLFSTERNLSKFVELDSGASSTVSFPRDRPSARFQVYPVQEPANGCEQRQHWPSANSRPPDAGPFRARDPCHE